MHGWHASAATLSLALLPGCTPLSALANLGAVIVCLLALVGALSILFGSLTVSNHEGERVVSLGDGGEPADDVVLAKVVTWACARQREGIVVTGGEVLRVIAEARRATTAAAVLALCLLGGCDGREIVGWLAPSFALLVTGLMLLAHMRERWSFWAENHLWWADRARSCRAQAQRMRVRRDSLADEPGCPDDYVEMVAAYVRQEHESADRAHKLAARSARRIPARLRARYLARARRAAGIVAALCLCLLSGCEPISPCYEIAALARPGGAMLCHEGATLSAERTATGLDLLVCRCPGAVDGGAR